MSFGKIQSLKSISHSKESIVKTELDIIDSYLSIDQWRQNESLSQILMQKLKKAIKIKEKLMQMHGITDVKDVVGFRCQVCAAVFAWPTALGGHMSKAHPSHKKKASAKLLDQEQLEYERMKKEDFQHEVTGIHRDDLGYIADAI